MYYVLFKIDVHKATSLFSRVPVNVRCILEQVYEYRLLYSQKAEGRNLYCHWQVTGVCQIFMYFILIFSGV